MHYCLITGISFIVMYVHTSRDVSVVVGDGRADHHVKFTDQ